MSELEQVLNELKENKIIPTVKKPASILAKPQNHDAYKKLLLESLNSSSEKSSFVDTTLGNNFKTPFVFVDSVREMSRVFEPYKSSKAVSLVLLAFDSNGNPNKDPYLAEPAYLALSFNESEAIILDLANIKLSNPMLSSLFESSLLKVLFNAPDLLLFTRHLNIDVNNVSDMRILDQLLRKGLGNLSPTLTDTVNKYLGTEYEFPQLFKAGSLLTIQSVLATQAALIHQLASKLYPLIREEGMQKLAILENRATLAITEMLYNGMPIDISLFKQIKKQRQEEVNEISQRLQSVLSYSVSSSFGEVPRSVNLDSPPQVIKALKRIGIDVPNTSKETLLPFAEKHEEVKLFLEYRQKAYLLNNTLSDNYLNHIHPFTKRIHAHIEQNQASTGRILTSKPNLQGVAHGDPRRVFRASQGWVFVTGDYKQIDVVATAVIAQDQVMLDEIKRGEDIYIAAGKTFLQKNSITPEERNKCKPVVLGLIYNMSDYGLCNESKAMGSELSLKEAAMFRKLFFDKYKGIKRLHETLKESSKNTREVKSLMNRKRRFDNHLIIVEKPVDLTRSDLVRLVESALPATIIKYNNGVAIKASTVKDAEEYQQILTELDLSCEIVLDDPPLGEVFNGPAQMSVADLIKTAMYQMLPVCKEYNSQFVMSTHDDLRYYMPEESSKIFAEVLKSVMESASLSVFGGVKANVEVTIKEDFS